MPCRAVVAALKERGLTSPYLKHSSSHASTRSDSQRSTEFDFNDVIDKTIAAATRFKVDRVRQEDVARIGGGPPEED